VNEDPRVENRGGREEMVRTQIAARDISDEKVLGAMKRVPRELFVRPEDYRCAFYDGPLSIGCGQTISQPYIVAYMTELLGLRGGERVLEIGTGSGYQTAVLAEIAGKVCTVEIIPELSRHAQEILASMGYSNIEFKTGDGGKGWPEKGPFDAIIVTAAPANVPRALKEQLLDGGRLIIPVGSSVQYIHRITRSGDKFNDEGMIAVRFVPLTGRAGGFVRGEDR
jgi:protein-L-isoaspartate(D-aspartate) O-methyltransferase